MRARGQAVTELSLALLILVPTLLLAIFLAESSIFRLEATEAATEPLWDATAYSQQQYEGGFVQTPAAINSAQSRANGRMRARSMVFTVGSAATVNCGPAPDMGYVVAGTVGPYQENGGIACRSQLRVDEKGLPRGFLDQSPSGFFQEPLANLRRNFDFRENEKGRPFKMAIGDWGMTKQGSEPEECGLTMDSCQNNGFFTKAQTTFTQNNNFNGVKGREHVAFMNEVIKYARPPQDFDRVTDFQMSFRGETSPHGAFMEDVPVVEGERRWWTTPFWYARERSYNNRTEAFLGGI